MRRRHSPSAATTDQIACGADALFTVHYDTLNHVGYSRWLWPRPNSRNCVAHNGSLVPVLGRDIMVQAWYQGGVSVFDFTDPSHPKEIAYFDRGPIDSTKLVLGGFWSAYYYDGYIYGSEIARGLDVFKLTPTADLTQNEIDAANLVHLTQLNAQSQPTTWPAAYLVARAYIDQLVRDNGLPASRTSAIRSQLDRAQHATGAQRTTDLRALATQLDQDAGSATDATRVRALATVVRGLEQAKA